MKDLKDQPIEIPLEFKVACSIYKVSIAEVLQIFIDHVTLYDLMDKNYHEGFSEGCHTLIYCIKKKGKTNPKGRSMRNCKDILSHNLHEIEILASKKKRGWKTTTKRSYTQCFVNSIYNAMERLYAPANTVYLDEVTTLHLNKNFCVLCERYECYPKEFLEYFMSYISVADAHACMGLKYKPNFIYTFFFKIANGFGRDVTTMIELTDWELDFYDRMNAIRLETHIIRDLQKRADVLREFYLTHYQTMNPN